MILFFLLKKIEASIIKMKGKFVPSRANSYNPQDEAEIDAALSIIPEDFKEMASSRYREPRLVQDALKAAKGEEVSRFDNMGDMFIVEIPGLYGPRLGLAYITYYVGFGDIDMVLIQNNDGNTMMYAEKGKLTSADNGSDREYKFYKVKRELQYNAKGIPLGAKYNIFRGVELYDPVHGNPSTKFFELEDMENKNTKPLHKNVPRVNTAPKMAAPVLPTRSMGTGIPVNAPVLPPRSMGTGIEGLAAPPLLTRSNGTGIGVPNRSNGTGIEKPAPLLTRSNGTGIGEPAPKGWLQTFSNFYEKYRPGTGGKRHKKTRKQRKTRKARKSTRSRK